MGLLEQREVELKKKMKAQRSEEDRLKARQAFAPEFRYNLSGLDNPEVFRIGNDVRVFVDSTAATPWTFDDQKGRDTIFRGPTLIIKEIPDSLSTPYSDSLSHSANNNSFSKH